MEGAPENIELLRIRMSGPDFDDVDKIINRNTILDLPAEGAASLSA